MKKMFLSLLAVAVSLVANAQFGAKIAWDVNIPSSGLNKVENIYNSGSGFSLGALYNVKIAGGVYFEPQLNIFYNTIGLEDVNVLEEDVASTMTMDGTLRNFGLRIPLLFGYRLSLLDDMAISFFTGAQFNIGITMKQHIGTKVSVNNLSVTSPCYGRNGDFNRFDSQWVIGARLHVASWFLDFHGGIGMGNMMKEIPGVDRHFRRNTLSLGIGKFF